MFYAISSQDAGEAPARCSDPSTPTRSFLRDIIQPVHIAQIGTNRRSAKSSKGSLPYLNRRRCYLKRNLGISRVVKTRHFEISTSWCQQGLRGFAAGGGHQQP
jgi:hypothetical protein